VTHAATALRSAPAAVLVLGLGGLVPFFALALLAALVPERGYAYFVATLAQYGAVICSFVGALNWGYAVRDDARGAQAWQRYGISVVPALAAWLALQTPVWTALRLEAAILIGCLAVERLLPASGQAPPWLAPLRYVLTIGAALALVAASVA
jgi:putative flippase GtrA